MSREELSGLQMVWLAVLLALWGWFVWSSRKDIAQLVWTWTGVRPW